jgi:hypothetical protein
LLNPEGFLAENLDYLRPNVIFVAKNQQESPVERINTYIDTLIVPDE